MSPRRHHILNLVLIGAALAGVTGCAASAEPPPQPTPTRTVISPLFASNEEALAAATAAYAAYLETSDLILSEGGAEPERIRLVASRTFADIEISGYDKVRAQGLHTIGTSGFDSVTMQQVDEKARDGVGIVVAYLCLDVSQTDVLYANGASAVSAARPDRIPFEVTFDRSSSANSLIVAKQTVWSRGGVC
ncbi:hypothetical protein E3T55_18565 [Cryobacterium frigoriphilum]|uniref:Uncharacterized protein n=1 Tax=Cryobacterium frigoriphilum TaxID=1259150 RepID=A0A4V3IQG1_9MICO|nr:hypothetical protein [Cryobacterium frigoriphilum]TFD45662.1 hypothetical protein E3T55_18565 [Cryobacterium frigoriphilum]